MLVTPGVDNMVLALSNLSQLFTFFPLPVRFLLLGTLGAPQVGRYREVLSCSRRSMWIGCCRPIVTKNAPLWPTDASLCCSSVEVMLPTPLIVRPDEYVAEMEKCCPQASSGRQPRRG